MGMGIFLILVPEGVIMKIKSKNFVESWCELTRWSQVSQTDVDTEVPIFAYLK